MEKRVLEIVFMEFLKYSEECHSLPEACSCSLKTEA